MTSNAMLKATTPNIEGTTMRNELPTRYDKLRLMLEHNIPPNITTYQQYHALLVEHAKRY